MARIKLEYLPRIPPKGETPPKKFEQIAHDLTEKMESGELTISQKGWLAEWDTNHGTGELKARLFEEITKTTTTTETQRRMVDLPPPSPMAEQSRSEGNRLDRVIASVAEARKEESRAIAQLAGRLIERENKLDLYTQQLFEDQRQLLQLAFTYGGALNGQVINALETLQNGVNKKAEAEVALVQAQAQAQVQAASEQKPKSIKEKAEDLLVMGVAAKLGVPPELFMGDILGKVAKEDLQNEKNKKDE